MRRTFEVLERLTGIPGPRTRIPYSVAFLAACFDEIRARVTRKPPRAPLAAVWMAKYKMFFNPARAIRELGLPQTPVEQAFTGALDWFQRNGYAA